MEWLRSEANISSGPYHMQMWFPAANTIKEGLLCINDFDEYDHMRQEFVVDQDSNTSSSSS
jgi:hypothetical protein